MFGQIEKMSAYRADCVVAQGTKMADIRLGSSTIPKLEGITDVEVYLTWELAMHKFFRYTAFTGGEQITIASSALCDGALACWEKIVRTRVAMGQPAIDTWRAMSDAMRSRVVPLNYLSSLRDKLQILQQGILSVDDYFREMTFLLRRTSMREETEQTMQCFIAGLNDNIQSIVRLHPSSDMTDLLDRARRAELQVAKDVVEDVVPLSGLNVQLKRVRDDTCVPVDRSQHWNLFQAQCMIKGKACKLMIDGGSCTNGISKAMVAALGLSRWRIPEPKHLEWLNSCGMLKVTHKVRVDEVECDVLPLEVCGL